MALIKPQFEAGKEEADRGAGVIRDASVHERVLQELEDFVEKFADKNRGLPPPSLTHASLHWAAVTDSPLLGPAGNKEFLVLIEKTS